MQAHMTVAAGEDTEDEVRSLYRWLKDGDHKDLTIDIAPGVLPKDAMGPVTDTVAVALSGGSAVATIATSLFGWLRHRRSDVHLSIRNQSGDSLEVDATAVASADEFTRAVMQLLGGEGNAPARP